RDAVLREPVPDVESGGLLDGGTRGQAHGPGRVRAPRSERRRGGLPGGAGAGAALHHHLLGHARPAPRPLAGEPALPGRRGVAGRFRELEVELTGNALPDTMERVLARLREAGAEDAGGTSKYRRALGDREVGPPELDQADLPPHPSAEELLRHDLTASVLRL